MTKIKGKKQLTCNVKILFYINKVNLRNRSKCSLINKSKLYEYFKRWKVSNLTLSTFCFLFIFTGLYWLIYSILLIQSFSYLMSVKNEHKVGLNQWFIYVSLQIVEVEMPFDKQSHTARDSALSPLIRSRWLRICWRRPNRKSQAKRLMWSVRHQNLRTKWWQCEVVHEVACGVVVVDTDVVVS